MLRILEGVDVRAKTFVAEASSRLGAVLRELGFVGPEIAGDTDAFPLVIEVRYYRAEVTVQCQLVLAYGGEEHVCTSLLWAGDGPRDTRRVKVGDNSAHTGYQMRRALDRHAEAVSEPLRPVREALLTLRRIPAPIDDPSEGVNDHE